MSDPTRRAVILAGARTPFGKLNGALASTERPSIWARWRLARLWNAPASRRRISRTRSLVRSCKGERGKIRLARWRCVPACGIDVPAETINRVCGSGMRAITLAESLIRVGDYDVVLAGGMESMTNAPYILRKARTGYRMGDGVLEDMMIGDGLMCAVAGCHMGIHGGNVAAEEGVSREEQDAWALRSHQRAIAAQDSGLLAREIAPVEIAGRGDPTSWSRMRPRRRDTSEEALAKLKPAFDAGRNGDRRQRARGE